VHAMLLCLGLFGPGASSIQLQCALGTQMNRRILTGFFGVLSILKLMPPLVGQELTSEYQKIERTFREAISKAGTDRQQQLNATDRRNDRLKALSQRYGSTDSLTVEDHQVLAGILKTLGENERAVEVSKSLLAKQPADNLAHQVLLSIAIEQGSEEEVVAEIQKSLDATNSLQLVAPYFGSLAIRMSVKSEPERSVKYFMKFFQSCIELAEDDCMSVVPLQNTLPIFQAESLKLGESSRFRDHIKELIDQVDALLARQETDAVTSPEKLESALTLVWLLSILDGYAEYPKLIERVEKSIDFLVSSAERVGERRNSIGIFGRILSDGLIDGSHSWSYQEIRDASQRWRRRIEADTRIPSTDRSSLLAALDTVDAHLDEFRRVSSDLANVEIDSGITSPPNASSLELRIGQDYRFDDRRMLDQLRLLIQSGHRNIILVAPESKVVECERLESFVRQKFTDVSIATRHEHLESMEIVWVLRSPNQRDLFCIGSSPQKMGHLCWMSRSPK